MQWYVSIVTISAAGTLGWITLGLLVLPIRALLELRRNVLEQMRALENFTLPKPRELAVSSWEIIEYDRAVRNVREAQRTLRELGYQLLAFFENEPAAYSALAAAGLNAAEAGNRLIELSVSYSQLQIGRVDLGRRIKKALRSTDTAKLAACISPAEVRERLASGLVDTDRPKGLISMRPSRVLLPS